MNTLPYLLTASMYLLAFYGCYWLLLRRNTFFGLNRLYLITSIAISLVAPLIKLPDSTLESLPVGTITLSTLVVGTPAEPDGLTTDQWLWFVYALGCFAMLLRLGIHIQAVMRLIGRGTAMQRPGYMLIRLPDDQTPSFSFGSYLVLNRTDARHEPVALITHEEAHIRQRHTADILFVEVIRAIFWFNPILWLYKKSIQEVHEFLADRAANQTSRQQTDAYARQLVAYALHVPATALTTPFVSKSTLKQRIVMLHKPASTRRALLSYLLTLPLAALLAMCTQSERDQPQTASEVSARKAVTVDGEIFAAVDQQPQFPGGIKNLMEYLSDNLKYPEAAKKANIEGRVFVSFVVTKTGEITDVKILKGIGYGADEEAVRVVERMPRWTPAEQDGQKVNVKYNLPINFQLENTADKSAANDFLKSLSKYEKFTLDGKPLDRQQAFSTIKKAKEDGIHIAFTIRNNTVVMSHVD